MTIKRGDIAALCGDNGSGKTTLLKIIGGLLKPVNGEITILDLKRPGLESLVGRVGFLFQNPDEQLFANTVEEEINFGPSHFGRKADVNHYIEMLGLNNLRSRHPQTLSRGQRQILAVASVMAIEPELLILDEPTTGLDSRNWHQLFFLLHNFADCGGTVVFSTHNEKAASAARRKLTMNNGRIVSDEVLG
jgi:energy-coupling factor transporter ATP-binding protein EcfA2